MAKCRPYLYFWAAVAILLPFYIRIEREPINILFTKDSFLIACAFFSILCFGISSNIGREEKICLGTILVLAAVNQHNISSPSAHFQWLSIGFGILVFAQMKTRLVADDCKFFLNVFSIIALTQAVWIILNYCGICPYTIGINIFYPKVARLSVNGGLSVAVPVTGSLLNSFTSGTLLSLTSLALLRKKWLFALPIVFAAMIMIDSATALICFFAGVLAYASMYIKQVKDRLVYAFLLVSCGFLGFILFLKELPFFRDGQRYDVWLKALTMNKGLSVIYGSGPGYFADNFNKLFQYKYPFLNAHNEFVEIYVAFGIVGVGVLAWLAYNSISKVKNKNIMAMIVGFLVLMITGFPLHISATSLIGIIIFTIAEKQGDQNGINNSN